MTRGVAHCGMRLLTARRTLTVSVRLSLQAPTSLSAIVAHDYGTALGTTLASFNGALLPFAPRAGQQVLVSRYCGMADGGGGLERHAVSSARHEQIAVGLPARWSVA